MITLLWYFFQNKCAPNIVILWLTESRARKKHSVALVSGRTSGRDLAVITRFACAVAGLCTTKRGAADTRRDECLIVLIHLKND